MNRLKMGLLASTCAAILTILFLSARVVQAASTSGGTWNVVASPNVTSNNTILNGVAAISTSDTWAVGYDYPSTGGGKTLAEHWNGSAWSIVASPSPGSNFDDLSSVAAISTKNVWAVGLLVNSSSVEQTLVEHWNGTAWSVIPSPNVASSSSTLFGVSAISASNIWAVGFSFSSGNPQKTLVEHWNGSKWKIVARPSPGTAGNNLSSVVALNTNNVWAVGSTNNTGGYSQTLIEHWNGSAWSIVSSPNIGTESNNLTGITAVSKNDLWTVGSYTDADMGLSETLIEQWNGATWSVVASPNPGVGMNYLTSVSAVSANKIWAVGSAFSSNSLTSQTLIEYWNGSTWSVVNSSGPGSSYNILYGVTRVPGTGHEWTVGYSVSGNNGLDQTLTEYKG